MPPSPTGLPSPPSPPSAPSPYRTRKHEHHDHREYKEKQVYDILIAGGGLTGAAAYCALATVARDQKLTMAPV